MKKILSYGLSAAFITVSVASLTSCIDDTEPTDSVTKEQVAETNSATDYLVQAIPAYMLKYWNSDYHNSWGYPAIMFIRDIETADVSHADPGKYYDAWFGYWGNNTYQGRDYVFAQFLWNFQTKMINTANNAVAAVDSTSASDEQKGYLAASLAYRASYYLDMAREYEFLENDKTLPVSPEGNNVSGLTVPIVTEATTEADSRNNPRATRETMAAFILGDLQYAERWIDAFTISDKTFPHLDCVYGLYARYYMWLENYPMAEKYARLAINASSVQPMSETDALDTSTGFNTLSKWMWGMQYTTETINNNLLNWFAWACNENSWGYAGPTGGGAQYLIDAAMYDRISDTDWRKLMWKAPAGTPLEGKSSYCDAEIGEALADYASMKFRPGSGDTQVYTTGNVGAIPLMRVEEMYFIEAEAAAHQDAARGKQLVESFMKQYRDSKYTCNVSSTDDVVEEIVFQKRVELWGEGQTFFDIKRLNYPVERSYNGTNHLSAELFNTTTRPAWMNWVIIIKEENGNAGVAGYNNPDPTDKYDPIPVE